MTGLKGYRTRLLNCLGLIILFATELMQVLPQLALGEQVSAIIRTGLLVLILIGNIVLRELTDTRAGHRT